MDQSRNQYQSQPIPRASVPYFKFASFDIILSLASHFVVECAVQRNIIPNYCQSLLHMAHKQKLATSDVGKTHNNLGELYTSRSLRAEFK